MKQTMTWDEIVSAYPGEWVAIADPIGDIDVPFGKISGELVTHNKDEAIFTQQLKKLRINRPIDIRYTGDILPNNPIAPILWQISDTNS